MQEPPSILVVDDEPNNFDTIEALLCSEGYTLNYASNGRRALEQLHLFKPDVILLDVMMPDLDGIEVCRLIKTQPEWQAVPIVMVTALTDKADLANCLAAGANDFISKPVNGLEMRARVAAMLRIKRQHDELEMLLALREIANERRYASLAAAAPVGIFRTDLAGRCIYVNQRWSEMTGVDLEEAVAMTWFEAAHPDDRPAIILDWERNCQLGQPFRQEYRLRHAHGREIWVFGQIVAEPDASGEIAGYVGTMTDIHALKQAQASLSHNANHDPLTNLPNRTQFLKRLGVAIARARQQPSTPYAVLFVDLDRLKIVNDSLGHLAGDRLLVDIAQKILTTIEPGQMAARIGGDEFAILLELDQPNHSFPSPGHSSQHNTGPVSTAEGQTINPEIEAKAVKTAGNLLAEFQKPFVIDHYEMYLGLSVGIVFGSPDYDNPYDLLRNADIAMYRAKSSGGNRYQIFDGVMYAQALERLTIEGDLRKAIERQEFVVYYQPIVDLTTQRPIGFEALIRWQHPQRGFVSPIDFVPIAEETGLIVPIDRWVLATACAQLVQWQSEFGPDLPLKISVNLSAKDLRHLDVIETIQATLNQTGLSPECLTLELTESLLIENIHQAIELLSELKALGVQISIDDFGTGYSSLNYLHRLPADILKIDRSFVSQMQLGNRNYQVVSAILALSTRLGLRVVAEGIEIPEQLHWLQQLGCNFGQGYLFSRPLAATDAKQFLKQVSQKIS